MLGEEAGLSFIPLLHRRSASGLCFSIHSSVQACRSGWCLLIQAPICAGPVTGRRRREWHSGYSLASCNHQLHSAELERERPILVRDTGPGVDRENHAGRVGRLVDFRAGSSNQTVETRAFSRRMPHRLLKRWTRATPHPFSPGLGRPELT